MRTVALSQPPANVYGRWTEGADLAVGGDADADVAAFATQPALLIAQTRIVNNIERFVESLRIGSAVVQQTGTR